ncbi:hypothetical protein [Ignavigranum ruoffiae]|uniref:hypothetical protein n=1 Tax=Ignavigranum ruoffiae TaxID=89093 RepID=UPI0024AD0F5A|nr:hypothetical protein [Ignavigranum ruoffiae]
METIQVYQCEIDEYIDMEYVGQVKYIGESFGVDSLTNNKVYYIVYDNQRDLKVVDDSGEDYLYELNNPKPLDGSSIGGKFVIVDDPRKILVRYI